MKKRWIHQKDLSQFQFFSDADGRRLYKKEMLRVGEYIHPKHGWKMKVTEDTLGTLKTANDKMRENGVDVEVVTNHSPKAEDVYGYVVDTAVEPNHLGTMSLYGIHEFPDEESEKLAKRCKNVSVCIEDDVRDGHGNEYGQALIHSAIVQRPVMPSQTGFVKMSAEDNAEDVPLYFSIDDIDSELKQIGDNKMRKELSMAFGSDTELEESDILKRVKDAIADAGKVEDLEKQVEDKDGEIKELSLQVKAGSLDDKDPNAQRILNFAADTCSSYIDDKVKAGEIDPNTAKQVKELFIGDSGKRKSFFLDSVESGTPEPVVRTVANLIAGNKPVELGEKSKGQHLMSRETPGDLTDEEKKEKKEFSQTLAENGAKTIAAAAGIKMATE